MSLINNLINPMYKFQNGFIDEIWLPINNIAVSNILHEYLISNYGRVFRLLDNKYLIGSYDSKGYLKVI